MSDLKLMVRPMRATVDAKAFSDALKSTTLVLKKSAIPSLEEVSVRFSNGRCILAATDLDTWITTRSLPRAMIFPLFSPGLKKWNGPAAPLMAF